MAKIIHRASIQADPDKVVDLVHQQKEATWSAKSSSTFP